MKNFKVLEKNICFNPETDDPITIKEIQFVLNKLKNSKAGGPDGIINQIYVIESYMIYSIALDSDPILKLN
jgi:hypothetical protein